ncbi:hypothetical protein Tco_0678501 [Tanacetum coccineum]|uniref:Synaptobrevin, longin-like domain protein n=1 Tax=Tanacetum coccineum TaxID=301880 RepID=A0ABQ4XFT5_9ASTR
MKGQDNPLIPNPHLHLRNSTIKKPIIVPLSYQPKKTHKPRTAIRTTKISQSSGPINLVADETVYKEGEDKKKGLPLLLLANTETDRCNQIRPIHGTNLMSPFPQELISALVDKKKVIITETSIRSDLHLEDAGGIDCLPTATIFEELARMGYEKPSQKLTFYKAFFSPQWKFLIHTITQCLSAKTTAWNEFSSTMASTIICLATNQKFNLSKYIFDAMKKQSRRKQKKTTAVPHPSDSTADVPNEESVPTHSNDPLLSGEDRLKLTDLMDMCTKLSKRVLDLEHIKTTQAQEITNLKLRVKKLEKKAGLRTHKFKRLYKVGVTRRVEYSDDESLGAQKDAFNQGRSIEDIDKDAKVSLVDETQGRSDDAEMFDTDTLIGNEFFTKNDMIKKDQDVIPKEVNTAAPSTTAMSPPVITEVEITLAQTLAKLKSAKSKVEIQELVQSKARTAPSTIPKAKGITFRDAGESTTRTPTSVSSSSIKDKGKAKMDELEVPLKKKDQIALDEEMAQI